MGSVQEFASPSLHDPSPKIERLGKLIRYKIETCRRCPLSSNKGIRPVPFWGPFPNKIAVLGEAPWTEETAQGRPFVGPAGSYLRGELELVGIDPDELFWCNAISCAPLPGPRTPHADELKACHPHLRRQLRLADPNYVLLVGGTALKRVRPHMRITQEHGKPLKGKKRTWFPIFHPAYIMRKGYGEYQDMMREDLQRFAEMVQ